MKEIKKQQIGYPVDSEVNDATRFWADGACMDSAKSPIRIKDGQRLIAHKYKYGDGLTFADYQNIKGKVCVILYRLEGVLYGVVKEVWGIDEIANALRLKYYNPEETIVSLKIDYINQIYIVDGTK